MDFFRLLAGFPPRAGFLPGCTGPAPRFAPSDAKKGVNGRRLAMNGYAQRPLEGPPLQWLMLAFSFGMVAWIVLSH
jgi:hypothetical protein